MSEQLYPPIVDIGLFYQSNSLLPFLDSNSSGNSSSFICPSPLVYLEPTNQPHSTVLVAYESCVVPCPTLRYDLKDWGVLKLLLAVLIVFSSVVCSVVFFTHLRECSRYYVRVMFIAGFLGYSIVVSMFSMINLQNNQVICANDSHFILRNGLCVFQAAAVVWCFTWINTWSAILAVDTYLHVNLTLKIDSISRVKYLYRIIGFGIPTIVTIIPLAYKNLGFDPKGNIPICFYIVSQNSNFFKYTFLPSYCLLLLVTLAFTLACAWRIHNVLIASNHYRLYLQDATKGNAASKANKNKKSAKNMIGNWAHPRRQHKGMLIELEGSSSDSSLEFGQTKDQSQDIWNRSSVHMSAALDDSSTNRDLSIDQQRLSRGTSFIRSTASLLRLSFQQGGQGRSPSPSPGPSPTINLAKPTSTSASISSNEAVNNKQLGNIMVSPLFAVRLESTVSSSADELSLNSSFARAYRDPTASSTVVSESCYTDDRGSMVSDASRLSATANETVHIGHSHSQRSLGGTALHAIQQQSHPTHSLESATTAVSPPSQATSSSLLYPDNNSMDNHSISDVAAHSDADGSSSTAVNISPLSSTVSAVVTSSPALSVSSSTAPLGNGTGRVQHSSDQASDDDAGTGAGIDDSDDDEDENLSGWLYFWCKCYNFITNQDDSCFCFGNTSLCGYCWPSYCNIFSSSSATNDSSLMYDPNIETDIQSTKARRADMLKTVNLLRAIWHFNGRSMMMVIAYGINNLIGLPMLIMVLVVKFSRYEHSSDTFVRCLVNASFYAPNQTQAEVDSFAEYHCGRVPDHRASYTMISILYCMINVYPIVPLFVFGLAKKAKPRQPQVQ